MLRRDITIALSDLKNMLEAAHYELTINEMTELENIVVLTTTLTLVIITELVLKKNDAKDPIVGDVMKIIGKINTLNRRTSKNQTLLNLCFAYDIEETSTLMNYEYL